MVIKVLLVNFPLGSFNTPKNVAVTWASLKDLPPLHDFHVVIIDVETLLSRTWDVNKWVENDKALSKIQSLSQQLLEQTKTGGWTFIFNGVIVRSIFKDGVDNSVWVANDLWLPPMIKLVPEGGDSFYVNPSELRYYSNLMNGVENEEISWRYYVSEYPEDSRVIATNRANYAVFLEVPNGLGRYVLLPKFKDRDSAIAKIVNGIIPQVIQEESVYPIPDWIKSVEHHLEANARKILHEINIARKVLYTQDRELERSSKKILEKMGFDVEILPRGPNADLKITYNKKVGLVEIKGHSNRQETVRGVGKLFEYLSDTDLSEKGIFIANHEFSKDPEERSPNAYTPRAIEVADNNNWALLDSISLWKLFLLVLEGEISDDETADIRKRIFTGKGLIDFSDKIS